MNTMLELLKYMTSGFWVFTGSAFIIATIAGVFSAIILRLFRVITVLLRGWPPTHLDADGDFNENEIEEQQNK